MAIRFGDFALDLERRELRDRSGAIHLTPKAFQLLQVLVESRPKAISQAKLYNALWPGTYVQHTNLHNLIHELRIALHDDGRKIIRTNFGFGFSFAANAFEDDGSPAAPRIFVGDHGFDLQQGENIIGREVPANVRINGKSISRVHARITVTGDGATIEDLGSKNGTVVRGSRLHGPAPLYDGDELRFRLGHRPLPHGSRRPNRDRRLKKQNFLRSL